MPTFQAEIHNRQPLLAVAITTADSQTTRRTYQALLDTGAQATLVSPKAIDELGLIAIGTTGIIPANGVPITTYKYRARIDIPIDTGAGTDLRGKTLDIAGLPFQPRDYDVILGMDFLFGFHFTMYRNYFILSS